MSWICACGVLNLDRDPACESCGAVKGKEERKNQRRCGYCGTWRSDTPESCPSCHAANIHVCDACKATDTETIMEHARRLCPSCRFEGLRHGRSDPHAVCECGKPLMDHIADFRALVDAIATRQIGDPHAYDAEPGVFEARGLHPIRWQTRAAARKPA